MTMFGELMPLPQAGLDDEGLWQAYRQQRLVFRYCTDCAHYHHPPLPVCPHCQSGALEWRDAHGPSEIFSFTEVHHPAHPAVAKRTPYVVIVVAFPEMNWVRLVSNLLGDGTPRIGAAVELVWDRVSEDVVLPRFRLAKS
jgi:uncharacterized protein